MRNTCDRFLVAICDDLTTDTWKDQLDFDRTCTSPEQRCWLCLELTPWNQLIHDFGFKLVEYRPGHLRLRSRNHYESYLDWDRATEAAKVSFVLSWLLQHHACIDELQVSYRFYLIRCEEKRPLPISLSPAVGSASPVTLRSLHLQQRGSARFGVGHPKYCFQLEGLDAVVGLERVVLECKCIEPKFAAELAKLLRRNAGSIRRLEIVDGEVPRKINHALRHLLSCESLTISSSISKYVCLRSVRPVVRLLHSSTALKELSIGPVATGEHLDAIARELESNATLTKLGVHLGGEWPGSPQAVFTALRDNTALKELRVTNCNIRGECAQALALLVRQNTGLRLLSIGEGSFFFHADIVQFAAALKVNTTLETVQLSIKMLAVDDVVELCKALRVNKTLKELLFTDFEGHFQESRAALAMQLAQDECYHRVKLPWAEPDVPGLAGALTSASAGFEEFHLPDTRLLSTTGLKQLFDALDSNKSVRTLRLHIKDHAGEKGTAFCKMLKVNTSIECLDLTIDRYEHKFVEEVSHALAENASVTEVVLRLPYVHHREPMTAVSDLLAHNRTAAKFSLHWGGSRHVLCVENLSRGMLLNKTIVKFVLAHNCSGEYAGFAFFEAVRRNRGALYRAVDFVVSPSLDRQCAAGFDLFNGRPCLLKQVKKALGKAEPEARLAIAAAERYLRDNYLVITGIVRHGVSCHPSKATQVDALNGDCWLAIVRHLKVADVLT